MRATSKASENAVSERARRGQRVSERMRATSDPDEPRTTRVRDADRGSEPPIHPKTWDDLVFMRQRGFHGEQPYGAYEGPVQDGVPPRAPGGYAYAWGGPTARRRLR
jgi:hypothetical protein